MVIKIIDTLAEVDKLDLLEVDTELSASEWLEAARNSSTLSGQPIGFYSDENGKIITLRGNTYFSSKRDINAIMGKYDHTRIANLCNSEDVKLSDLELQLGKGFHLLPQNLSQLFIEGRIVITKDESQIGEVDFSKLMLPTSDNKNFINFFSSLDNKNINSNPSALPAKFRYNILHFSYREDEDQGRTGVLLDKKTNEPLIVEYEGKEYVIELKGCGLGRGGFGDSALRSGEGSIYGAATKKQAFAEIDRLNTVSDSKCIGAVALAGTYKGREIAYVVRLTPSTVRASYSDNDAYPKAAKVKSEIVKAYAHLFINQIFSETPFLMRNSAHHENILISGKDNFEWTDFSDHLPLNGNDPIYNTPSGVKDVVRQFFYGLSEVPGVRAPDELELKILLNRLSRDRGVELNLEESDDYQVCAEKIWDALLLSRIYESRKGSSFKLLDQDNISLAESVSIDNWETLKPSLLKAADSLIETRAEDENIVRLTRSLKDAIKKDRLFDAYDFLYKLSQIELGLHLPFAGLLDFSSDIGLFSVTRVFEAEEEFINDYAIMTMDSNLLSLSERENAYKAIQDIYNDGLNFLENIEDSVEKIISHTELFSYK